METLSPVAFHVFCKPVLVKHLNLEYLLRSFNTIVTIDMD